MGVEAHCAGISMIDRLPTAWDIVHEAVGKAEQEYHTSVLALVRHVIESLAPHFQPEGRSKPNRSVTHSS
jgi:hypothetical protein